MKVETIRPSRGYSMDDAIYHGNLTNEVIVSQWLPIWTRNAFAQHALVDPERMNLKLLYGAHAGETAIIVSTGPSLDRNLVELEALGRKLHEDGRYRLIATTSALNPLLANGWRPDYAAINDGQPWVAEWHWQGLEDLLETVPLFLSTTCHPATARAWSGPRYYYNDFAPSVPLMAGGGVLETVWPELYNVPVSGCTTNCAIRLATLLGFGRIVLIGSDLSFDAARKAAHGTKYNRNVEKWAPREPDERYFVQKGQWLVHVCPKGHTHWIEARADAAGDGEPKCPDCNAVYLEYVSSTEYLFYLRNLLQIAREPKAMCEAPTGEQELREFELVNATGGGIARSMTQRTLAEVFA